MTTAPNTPNTPAGIEQDIPCERCGYNLRGLTGDGQCPECGLYTRLSIETWNAQRNQADIWASDPRWIRKTSEGLVLALVVFILMMLSAGARLYSSGSFILQTEFIRFGMLGTMAIAFVLSWAAAWKLSIPEKRETTHPSHTRSTLRVGATVYLVSIFLTHVIPAWRGGFFWIAFVFILIVIAIIPSIAWFLRMAELAQRCGDGLWVIQATLLALSVVIIYFVSELLGINGRQASLSPMHHTHLIQFGPMSALEDIVNSGMRGFWNLPQIFVAIFPVWSAIVAFRLLLMLRRAARAGSSPSSTA